MEKNMRKILIGLLLGLSSWVQASTNIVVSIPPQQTFVQAIGGDKVSLRVMVKPGNSPHTYEPKPSQMRDIAKADIYLSIGVEFEKVWLPRFVNQNSKMRVVDISKGIERIEIAGAKHSKQKHESMDPHIWTSPNNVKKIASNILQALIGVDSSNKKYYEDNYNRFIKHIDETDSEIKAIFARVPSGLKFMVFHPSWGYFAQQYGLEQMPIEIEGKAPKPREVVTLIEIAKKADISAVLTAPEFSDAIAKQIARELSVEVIKISPLNPHWADSLIDLAKRISHKKISN
jgi:zinc transport system substrate-binding protein